MYEMKLIMIKRSLLFTIVIFFCITLISIVTTHMITKEQVTKEMEKELNPELVEENCDICEDDETTPRQELLRKQYENKKLIALTFDDGPSKYTSTLVDELNKRQIPVTFFILGESAEKFPDTLKFQADSGNEIGIHSYTHKLFTKLKEEEILEQIDKTRSVILKLTQKDASLIRVPYGSRNEKIDGILSKVQLTDVLWTVDSKDWKLKNTNKVYLYILKKVKGNDIILMHDTFKTSVEAALKVVDKLTAECYTFVTVSELLETKAAVEGTEK